MTEDTRTTVRVYDLRRDARVVDAGRAPDPDPHLEALVPKRAADLEAPGRSFLAVFGRLTRLLDVRLGDEVLPIDRETGSVIAEVDLPEGSPSFDLQVRFQGQHPNVVTIRLAAGKPLSFETLSELARLWIRDPLAQLAKLGGAAFPDEFPVLRGDSERIQLARKWFQALDERTIRSDGAMADGTDLGMLMRYLRYRKRDRILRGLLGGSNDFSIHAWIEPERLAESFLDLLVDVFEEAPLDGESLRFAILAFGCGQLSLYDRTTREGNPFAEGFRIPDGLNVQLFAESAYWAGTLLQRPKPDPADALGTARWNMAKKWFSTAPYWAACASIFVDCASNLEGPRRFQQVSHSYFDTTRALRWWNDDSPDSPARKLAEWYAIWTDAEPLPALGRLDSEYVAATSGDYLDNEENFLLKSRWPSLPWHWPGSDPYDNATE